MSRRILVCLVSLMLFGVACGERVLNPVDQARGILTRTETKARRFIYNEGTGENRISVVGIILDDYGYRARISINGEATIDEVALDDALAIRFLKPEAISDFLAEATTPPAGEAFNALRSRRWVLDRSGAPDLTRPGFQARTIGEDPTLDGLTVFDLYRKAINESEGVAKYNPQALTYVAGEDPFPKPEEGSEVERFDLIPALLRPVTGSPNDTLPDAPNFRRMSMYVKDGVVLRILESIDLSFRLTELQEALDLDLTEAQARQFLERGMDALNELRTSRGLEPIRPRTMSYQLVDIGKPAKVELPSDFIEGSLSFLRNRGKGAGTLPTGGTSAPTAGTGTTSPAEPGEATEPPASQPPGA
jgi:hypothetical protein